MLLRAFLGRSATDLTLKALIEVAEETEEETGVAPVIVRSLFDNSDLLKEIVDSVFGLESLERCLAVAADEGRSRRDCLVRLVCARLERFKRYTFQDVPQLVHHWTVSAFEDNVERIAELIVLLELVSKNVGGISRGKSLLRSMAASTDICATEDGLS